MASLQLDKIKPFPSISEKAIPPAIRSALKILFSQIDKGVLLVGGTALAGFYAEHRRSDDIDLFCVDQKSHRIAILAAKHLQTKNALFSNERTTPNFYHADCAYQDHKFTLDIVLDANMGEVGSSTIANNNIAVADLKTLFAMKVACLISRVSEKDIFDIDWFLKQEGEIDIGKWIEVGLLMDGGMSAESLLIGLQGAILREEACHFLLKDSKSTPKKVHEQIENLRKKLIKATLDYEKKSSLKIPEDSLRKSVKS